MKTPQPQRGIFEKVPGSGVWWIRFTDSEGRYRREKVGAYGLAEKLLAKRRGDAVVGKKLPEMLRRKFVSFGELADDAIEYVKGRYSRPADDVARLELLKEYFPGSADAVKPKEIKQVLTKLAAEKKWSASSRNHHHNLISVAYRVGIENEKVEVNPARGSPEKRGQQSRALPRSIRTLGDGNRLSQTHQDRGREAACGHPIDSGMGGA